MSENKYGEPWWWEYNPQHGKVTLFSKGQNIVMDFVRHRMHGAIVRFNVDGLMHKASDFGVVIKGQEHNASWYQGIDNPTANRIVLCVNACAGRTPEQIAEAFRLLDAREKVVEKLTEAQRNEFRRVEDTHFFGRPRTKNEVHEVGMKNAVSYRCLTTALALLQAEKEGKA